MNIDENEHLRQEIEKRKAEIHIDRAEELKAHAVEFAQKLAVTYVTVEKDVYVEYGPQEYDKKKKYTLEQLYDNLFNTKV